MSTPSYGQITHNGLWKNNPALVQLLGLCPLLAVTASVVNALGLAIATLFVLVTSNLCVSLIRNVVTDSIRLPAFVLIIAAIHFCNSCWSCLHRFNLDCGIYQDWGKQSFC